MRTFLRFPLCASVAVLALLCLTTPARAQIAFASGSYWQPAPISNGVPVRIGGKQYVLSASLVTGPIFWITGALNDSLFFTASLRPVDGGFLPTSVRATGVTLLAANRPVWRTSLSTSYFFLRPIWLPPEGWGQYQASGLPALSEGRTLLARIDVDTGRGTLRVDVPVIVPRPYPVLIPLATNP